MDNQILYFSQSLIGSGIVIIIIIVLSSLNTCLRNRIFSKDSVVSLAEALTPYPVTVTHSPQRGQVDQSLSMGTILS